MPRKSGRGQSFLEVLPGLSSLADRAALCQERKALTMKKQSERPLWLFVEANEAGFTGNCRVIADRSPWDAVEQLAGHLKEEGLEPEVIGIRTTLHVKGEGRPFWYWLEHPSGFGVFDGVRERGPGHYKLWEAESRPPPGRYRVTYSNLQLDPETGELELFVVPDKDGAPVGYDLLGEAIGVAEALVNVGAASIASVYRGEVCCWEARKE